MGKAPSEATLLKQARSELRVLRAEMERLRREHREAIDRSRTAAVEIAQLRADLARERKLVDQLAERKP